MKCSLLGRLRSPDPSSVCSKQRIRIAIFGLEMTGKKKTSMHRLDCGRRFQVVKVEEPVSDVNTCLNLTVFDLVFFKSISLRNESGPDRYEPLHTEQIDFPIALTNGS